MGSGRGGLYTDPKFRIRKCHFYKLETQCSGGPNFWIFGLPRAAQKTCRRRIGAFLVVVAVVVVVVVVHVLVVALVLVLVLVLFVVLVVVVVFVVVFVVIAVLVFVLVIVLVCS